jgi:hypothetical protein
MADAIQFHHQPEFEYLEIICEEGTFARLRDLVLREVTVGDPPGSRPPKVRTLVIKRKPEDPGPPGAFPRWYALVACLIVSGMSTTAFLVGWITIISWIARQFT